MYEQTKSPFTELARLSNHRDPRLNARPNLAPHPLAKSNPYQQTASVTPEARGSSTSILRPMLFESASMSEVVEQAVLDTLSAVWG